MVGIASLATLTRDFDGLEDPAVEADGVTARAERNPIQVDSRCARLHATLKTRPPSGGRDPDSPVPLLLTVRSREAGSSRCAWKRLQQIALRVQPVRLEFPEREAEALGLLLHQR